MQVVRCAKYVGTMIGPDGHIHRWTAPRKKLPARSENRRLHQKPGWTTVRPKIYAVSVLSYIGSIRAADKSTLKAEADALQCTTARPYNAIPTSLLGVGSVCGLGPDLVGIHSISLVALNRTAACSKTRSIKDLRRSRLPKRLILHLFLHSAATGKRNFLLSRCVEYCMSPGPRWKT